MRHIKSHVVWLHPIGIPSPFSSPEDCPHPFFVLKLLTCLSCLKTVWHHLRLCVPCPSESACFALRAPDSLLRSAFPCRRASPLALHLRSYTFAPPFSCLAPHLTSYSSTSRFTLHFFCRRTFECLSHLSLFSFAYPGNPLFHPLTFEFVL